MEIKFGIKVKIWKDKDDIWIVYSKKFDLYGYGESKKEALKMFFQSTENILWDSMSEKQKQHSSPSYKKHSMRLNKNKK